MSWWAKSLSRSLSQGRLYVNYINVHTQTIPIPKLKGCYPAVWRRRNLTAELWYLSYVQAYLDRNVRGKIRDTKLHDFQRFLKLLAARTAQELNQASLAKELGLSIPTIRSWISLLEASSIVFLLPPFHRNFGKRVIKAPKLYFMDTGLVCYLVGLQSARHVLDGRAAFSHDCCTAESAAKDKPVAALTAVTIMTGVFGYSFLMRTCTEALARWSRVSCSSVSSPVSCPR